jgi:dTDP-4-amino-4,6-dideoxygalactose transaminase
MMEFNVFNQIKAEIKNLTNITFVALAKRGNHAIEMALQIAKDEGKTKCLMFDQGGWITYPQFAEKLGFEIEVIPTNKAKVDLEDLKTKVTKDCVLIMHSLSGYFRHPRMGDIHKICQGKGAMLINDCCGSITKPELLQGDIFVCSFGKWKPINHGTGGFIGTRNSTLFYTKIKYDEKIAEEVIENPEDLLKKVERVFVRIDRIDEKANQILKELDDNGLSYLNNQDHLLLAIVCPYKSDESKQKIIKIAESYGCTFEECPRAIRVNKEAISIEVKRIE